MFLVNQFEKVETSYEKDRNEVGSLLADLEPNILTLSVALLDFQQFASAIADSPPLPQSDFQLPDENAGTSTT